MKMKKLAVLQFPGSNCERETLNAALYYGFDAEVIRWNTPRDAFEKFDAYILPGGFSYQDRIRAGVISSKLPIMKYLKEAALSHKPILGICNGCQILAEAGFFPNIAGNYEIEAALAPNKKDKSTMVGFICDWVYVKASHPQKNIFTKYFSDTDVLPVQINHGEGSFILKENFEIDLLTSLQYCNSNGEVINQFPINPNGSVFNLAGLSNKEGNVFAMMPHPERACFAKQIPTWLDNAWVQIEKKELIGYYQEGPWAKMFLSLFDNL
ncbi:MAG: phosphoribosylformylglycinamidine synthase I [Candidatus Margulisiibacteriota bacterium]|jgi:phosphoribosylformylglycinamidine synthase